MDSIKHTDKDRKGKSLHNTLYGYCIDATGGVTPQDKDLLTLNKEKIKN